MKNTTKQEITKQEISDLAERLVRKEIHANASWMIQELSDIEEYHESVMECSIKYPDYSEEIKELGENKEEIEGYKEDCIEDIEEFIKQFNKDTVLDFYNSNIEAIDKSIDPIIVELQKCIDDRENEQDTPIEASQYWIVSDWLIDELEEEGQLIVRGLLGFNIWGRVSYNQAIYIDKAMNNISKKLLIDII